MRYFGSPFGRIAFTDERLRHILTFHPDVKSSLRYFAQTLQEPEQTVPAIHDHNVIICYRYIARRKRFLAIVVKIGDYPFIVTAYLAKKIKKSTL